MSSNQSLVLTFFHYAPLATQLFIIYADTYTNMQSKVYRGGEEEATQSYSTIRRGADDDANKGRRMSASWYKLIKGIITVEIRRQFVVVDFLNKDIIES